MIKIYVMSTCPDCTQVKNLAANDPRYQLIDIGEHVRNLKEFLKLRDARPEFIEIKQQGMVGIPTFLREDGSVTFHANEVGLDLTTQKEDISVGATCSIDGTGC